MLAGTGAFRAETVSETLAEVMKSEPLWLALPPETPVALRNLVRRCLEKDPRQRVRDVGDVRLALEGAFELVAADTSAHASGGRALGWRPLILSLGILLIGAAITGAGIWFLRPASSANPEPVSRFTITLPADQPFSAASRHLVALSPQGTHLAYRRTTGSTSGQSISSVPRRSRERKQELLGEVRSSRRMVNGSGSGKTAS